MVTDSGANVAVYVPGTVVYTSTGFAPVPSRSATIYCVQPAAVWADVKGKHDAQAGKKSSAQVANERHAADEPLATTREERLRKNVTVYRHEWMIEKVRSLTTPDSRIAKGVTLHVLLTHLADHWKRQLDTYGHQLTADIAKAVRRDSENEDSASLPNLAEYLTLGPQKLDAFVHRAALAYAHQQDDEWLSAILDALNIDYAKDFALSPEYLDLYTKDQLQQLAREAKITGLSKDEVATKTALIDAMLRRAPKGLVPKEFIKAGRGARMT
jgi:hypothetical protein